MTTPPHPVVALSGGKDKRAPLVFHAVSVPAADAQRFLSSLCPDARFARVFLRWYPPNDTRLLAGVRYECPRDGGDCCIRQFACTPRGARR
jgi:hypothetical protein